MRILFLTDGIFPFQVGGMQKHSLLLSQLLVQKKNHVHIVHCGGENYSPEAFMGLYPLDTHPFISETFVKFPKTDPFPGHYIRENKMYSKNAYFEMEERLKEFDLIYAQGFTGWRFIKEKHRQDLGIPIVVNFHGYEMFQAAPNLMVKAAQTLFKNSVKWNIRNADYVYSFGGKITEIIHSLGVDEGEILLQSNGIGEEWLLTEMPVTKEKRKFLFIGRAERRKGIEELNKALEILLIDKSLDFSFEFIGPIPENQQLKDDRLTYHGEKRDVEEIREITQQCDCLVCPSHSEGMPTVILEAMASGLAIIGTNVGAVERQIDGNGILLDKPDVPALKNALLEMLSISDNDLLEHKLMSLKLVKEKFLWNKVVEQKLADFDKVIKEVANRRGVV